MIFQEKHFQCYILLANSANTTCRPFQVKINRSKLIIDRLQSRRYLTFLLSLFVTSRNLLFDVFLPRENSRKYQASATKRCTSLSKRSVMFRQDLSKVPWIFESLKNLYCTWTSSQKIFKISRIFFTYLQKPARALYSTHFAYSYSYL